MINRTESQFTFELENVVLDIVDGGVENVSPSTAEMVITANDEDARNLLLQLQAVSQWFCEVCLIGILPQSTRIGSVSSLGAGWVGEHRFVLVLAANFYSLGRNRQAKNKNRQHDHRDPFQNTLSFTA